MRLVLLALPLALACGPQAPPAPGPGPDLVARYADARAATIAEVRALPPLDRELAVVQLGAAWADDLAPLCAALDPGRIRARCERLDAARPLLSSPVEAWLEPPPALVQRWDALAPDPPACPADDHGRCLAAASRDAAMRGQLDAAAQACRALPAGRLQHDCFVAGALHLPEGTERFAHGLALCGGAGDMAVACHEELLLDLLPRDAADADRLAAGADRVRAAWHALSPAHAVRGVELYWALVAGRLLARLDPLPADLLAGLPPAATPHLRSARALRALGAAEPLAAALGADPLPPAADLPAVARWTRSPPGAPTLRRIPFRDLRGGLRPTHPEPAVDQGLALLTAAAQAEPPRLDLLAAALAPDQPLLLRWGAANLLAEVAPAHPAIEAARQDADVMVRRAVE